MNQNAPVTYGDLEICLATLARATGIAIAQALAHVAPERLADFTAALEAYAVRHHADDDTGLALEQIQAGAEEVPDTGD